MQSVVETDATPLSSIRATIELLRRGLDQKLPGQDSTDPRRWVKIPVWALNTINTWLEEARIQLENDAY